MDDCFIFETIKRSRVKSNSFNIVLSGFCFNCENYSENLKIEEGILLCEFCIE